MPDGTICEGHAGLLQNCSSDIHKSSEWVMRNIAKQMSAFVPARCI